MKKKYKTREKELTNISSNLEKIEHNLKHKARVYGKNVEIKKNISINKNQVKGDKRIMEEKVLYVGIDVAKAKFDVSLFRGICSGLCPCGIWEMEENK